MVDGFKLSDMVGTSICRGCADDMVLNPTLDILSVITRGGWNLRYKNLILLYLNVYKHYLHAGIELQGSHDLTSMIYTPNISPFVDKNNLQIVTKFASILFNTQVKALKHDDHLSTLRNITFALLMQNNEYLKGLAGEANMITIAFLQAADVLYIS